MKTKIKRMGDKIVINIDGKVDYETQEPFRRDLANLIREQKGQKTDQVPKQIIFDFGNLEFVGSCNISNLIQTLKNFNQQASLKPRYHNVRMEFQKLIRAFNGEDAFDFASDDTEGLIEN